MARKVINTFWDRKTRNDINDNFIELYEGITGELDVNRIPDKSINSSKLDDKSVTPSKTTFFTKNKQSKNLFDGNYKNGLLFHDNKTGLLKPLSNYSRFRGKTAVLPVERNTNYYVKVHDKNEEVFRVALSKEKPMFTSSIASEVDPLDVTVINSGAADPKKEEVLVENTDYDYLSVYVSNAGNEIPLQVEEGVEPTPYQNKYVIPSGYVEKEEIEEQKQEKQTNYFAFYEELKGIYEYNDTIEGIEEGSEIDIKMKSSEWLWGHYDDLMEANPDYITKRRIGYGSALDGSEDTSLPIYEYSFNPSRSHATHEVRVPIMLVQSGFHGHEKAAAWATYLFFKQLCESKETDDAMQFLRYNIDFRVVPIINKWGFDRYIRKNVRDIDMNNNFETDFTIVSESSSYYGGTEPMTEQETLTMDRWYQEFAHDNNVIGLVDMHNFISLPLGLPYLSWNLSRHVGVRTMMLNIGTHLDRKWRKEFPGVADTYPEGEQLQYTGQRISGTGRNQAYMKYGIKSVTIDPLKRIKIIDGSKDNDKYAVQVSLDLLGATVVGFVRNFA